MAEKILQTRIALKIDTLENWEKSTLGLKKGELAIATVAATAGTGLTEPVCMLKIGEDGVKTFSQLDWNVYAKASDVVAAAKSTESLTAFVNNVIANAGIASSDAMEALSKRVTDAETAITTLNGNDETAGSVAKAIKDAIAALNLETTYVAQETGKSLVADTEITKLAGVSTGANKVEASENGKIKIDGVDTVVYTHPDKHAINDVTGLQDALDGKQAAGAYAAEVHTHVKADITDFAHTHTASEVTDFATEVAKVKVTNATNADEATKATQDGNGKVIADTYAEKATTLAGYGIGDAYTKGETDTAVQGAKDYAKGLVDAIPAQTDYTVTITETTTGLANDIAKKYTFTQNGNEIGSIDLAKELVVTSGSVKEVAEAGKPYAGAVVGDKYIELVIANQDAPIYVPAKDLVDIYTAKDGATEVQVAISNTNEISATLTDAVKEKLNKAHTHSFADTDVEDAISKKHSHTFTDADVEDAISKEHTHSFSDEAALNGITSAKVNAWDGAVEKEHTHTFVETELNEIKAGDVAKWNTAEGKAHEHANADELALIVSGDKAKWDAAEAKAHEHSNKALLDTYTQTEANLADAVAKKHEHANADELAKFVDGDKTKLDSAVQTVTAAADSGLKATKTGTDVAIEIDDTITWVFDCGDSGVTA